MADGAVAVPKPTLSDDLYWCHQCKAEIHVTTDFLCPQCSGGFVEPVQESHRTGTGRLAGTGPFSLGQMDFDDDEYEDFPDGNPEDDEDDDDEQSSQAYNDFSRLLRTLIRGVPLSYDDDDRMGARMAGGGRRADRASRSGSGSTASTPGASTQNIASSPPTSDSAMPTEIPDNDAAAAAQAAQAAIGASTTTATTTGSGDANTTQQRRRTQRTGGGQRRRRRGHAGFLPLEEILEQMFTNSFGATPGGFGLSAGLGGMGAGGAGGGLGGGSYFMTGNPGDYAFGPRGLDDIITQLLNQYEGGGVAPAKEDEIAALPTDKITEKEVQCPVCFDEFDIGFEAKRLACKHAFREDCIVPWLKIHGTCPVCRSDLQGNPPPETDAKTGAPTAPPTGPNFDAPGTSGTQQNRPPAQARSQRPTNTFTFRAAMRPNPFQSPNAGGGVRNRAAPQNRSSSSTNNPNNNTNPNNNNRGGGTGGAGAGSGSSYLDQVD